MGSVAVANNSDNDITKTTRGGSMRRHEGINVLRHSKLTLSVLAALLGDAAIAQDAASTEEIVVTGSRVRQVTGMATPTPVTAMTMTELTDINPGSTVAEQLDELPQFFATPTAQRGGNAISTVAGGSYLNLRGMGLNRTLVLLDGTRVPPADANGSVNVDNFPTALIQRIDVVTGGASAAYGADAVAGVVNFVLDREFEGLTTRFSAGTTEQSDGENYNVSIGGGRSFLDDKLHLIGSVDAREIEQVGPDDERFGDWWQDWGLVRNPDWVSLTATPNIPQRITVPHVFGAQSSPQGLIITSTPGFAYRNWTFADDGTDIRPFEFGDYLSLTGVTPGGGQLNNQSGGPEYEDYTLASQRASLRGVRGNDVSQHSYFLGVKYDVSDRLVIQGQTTSGRTESGFYHQTSNMAIVGPLYAWTIYRENPYLPQRLATEMDRLGMASIQMTSTGAIDGPGLINIYDDRGDRSIGELESHTIGFDFDINGNWDMSFDYQTGKSTVTTGIVNVPRIDKFFMAMDAVRDPTTGQIVCNIAVRNPSPAELSQFMVGKLLPSPIDPLGVPADSPIGPLDPQECVPFNPFGIGNANQAAKDWIVDPEKKQERVLDQDFAELLFTGILTEGWGAGPLSLAAGLTWRAEEFTQVNFPSFGERGVLNAPTLGIRGIPSGFAGAGNRSLHPFSAIGVGDGDRDVWEWYSELNLPIWKWGSGQRLGSSLAYRSSDYKRAGRQDSWKIGLDAQIVQSLRLRATKSSDIREPNFAEIFLTGTGGGSVIDLFRNNEQNNALTVLATSNPALGAETGDTFTAGFVWQPTFAEWIDGLQLSLDWYDIELTDAVAPYGAQRIVDDCFATGAASACNLIQRIATTDGSVGAISRILNQNINADRARTRGVDLEIVWGFEPDLFGDQGEALTIRALIGRLDENSTTTAAGTTQDQAGAGLPSSRPKYSGIVTGNYNIGPWGFILQGTYFYKVMNNITWVEGRDVDDNWISAQTTFNFAASYRGDMGGGRQWRASFNITNLFDEEPPIVATANGQSLIIGHDTLGRRYNLGVNFDF
jgi:outer membrane receptor protein involved in Fe transport